jgi:COG2 N-terminal
MSLSFQNGTQLDRISTLIADTSGDDHSSESNTDLPIVASLSHNDHYLSSSTFSVEDFLVSRSHTSLPDLRQELRDYLGTLKEELVQLINDDYAAFISLSTDLQGEGARLERLKYPLKGVKREIDVCVVCYCLELTTQTFAGILGTTEAYTRNGAPTVRGKVSLERGEGDWQDLCHVSYLI